MSDTLYTLVSATTGFNQLEDTPIHVNTNAVLVSGHLGTSSNATINGNITVTGTVDGRDVAADGITTDQNFTTLNTGSARWNTNANTEIAAASARYNRTATSLETNVTGNTANWNTAYTHSQGSVTDHNDVSNAGSGQIITADERDKFTRAWTNLSTNSADYNEQFNSSEIAAASARYSRTATSLETNVVPNTADWNYTAANSAITLETSSHDYLSISNREITLGQVDISDDTNLAANNGVTLTGDTLSIDSVSASNFTAAYDHSRGNVTDHADVSNAGSGQIITSDERDRFGRAWTNISSNSADYNKQFNSSEIAAASARYTQTALSVETNVVPNTADWNYVAANSALTLDDVTSNGGTTSNNIQVGDATITGDLTVQGATIQADTIVTVTSALSVTNTGTGPALHVEQTGNNKVVEFLDDGTSVFSIANGGNISVKSGATVDGRDISVDGTNLDNTKTTVNSYSGNWNTAYTHSQGSVTDHSDVSNAGSGQIITAVERTDFSNTKTTVDDNSANWNTAYTHSQGSVTDHSDVSNAGSGQIITATERTNFSNTFTSLKASSADYDNTKTTLNSYSADWNNTKTTVDDNSANWNTAYTHSQGSVTDHSDVSDAGSGQIITATERTDFGNTKTTVDDNSANWNTAYTHSQGSVTDHTDVSNAGSGQIITSTERTNFTNTFTSLKANSADYDNTKTTVNTYSADWTWVAQNSSSGGESNEFSFKTITLSANRPGAAIGADIVADTTTDTLTLCAGPNIQLISEVGSDVITISGSAGGGGGGSSFDSSEIAAASGSWNSTNTTLKTVSTYKAFNAIALGANGGEVNSYGTTATLTASEFQDELTLTAGENIYFAKTDTDTLVISAAVDGPRTTSSIKLTGTGSTKHFEVSARIADSHHTIVTLGGIVQEPTTHYTISAASNHPSNSDVKDLNFTAAPSNGEKIEVRVFQAGLADTITNNTINNTVYSGATVTSTSNLTGTGTTHVFEVSARLSEAAMAIVSVGGIIQIPTTHYTVSAAAAHPTNADVADINFNIAPLSGELIEIRGLHDGTVLNETTITNTFNTVNNFSASWAQVWEHDVADSIIRLIPAGQSDPVIIGSPTSSAPGRFVVHSIDAGGAIAVLSGATTNAGAGLILDTLEGTFGIHVAPTGANENILYFNCGPSGPYAGAQLDYPGATTSPNAVVMSLSAIPNVINSGLLDINHIYARTKIGIGTVTPGEALSVIGNISASGDITAANNSYKFADGQKLTSSNVTDLKSASGSSISVTNLGTDNTPTIDFNASQMQRVTINGNCTFQDATNVAAGGNVVLEITGDSGGARTLAFPSGWKFIGAKPTTIKTSGLSLLQLLVFNGTSQTDVICTYNTQD